MRRCRVKDGNWEHALNRAWRAVLDALMGETEYDGASENWRVTVEQWIPAKSQRGRRG